MSSRTDWDDIKTVLSNSGRALNGNLSEAELVEYTESLDVIPKYASFNGGAAGALLGEEVGIYSNEDLNEASGLDGWEDPLDFGSIYPLVTAGFSGAITGGIALYGKVKLAEYVDDQHK